MRGIASNAIQLKCVAPFLQRLVLRRTDFHGEHRGSNISRWIILWFRDSYEQKKTKVDGEKIFLLLLDHTLHA